MGVGGTMVDLVEDFVGLIVIVFDSGCVDLCNKDLCNLL